MRRRLFNILAAVSLVLFVAVGAASLFSRYEMARQKAKVIGIFGPNVHIQDVYFYEEYFGIPAPAGVVLAATAILPALWLILYSSRMRRLRREAHRGLCLTCGYNLTGNVSGVCPECGTAILAEAEVG